MARILVTGGAGFVGSNLSHRLLEAGHEVAVLDSFTQYIQPPVDPLYVYNVNHRFNVLLKDVQIVRGSTGNKDDLRRRINQLRPDRIIHFAAMPLANMAIHYTEEAFNGIVGGTVNLLEVLRDVDFVDRFVYISSSMIYGDFEQVPVPEDSRKEPKEIYGGMKLAGEYMVKVYAQRYDIEYAIVRPSAVYGPTDNNRRVVGLFLTNALSGKAIRVKNADSTLLDFSFVDDVTSGIEKVALHPKAANETFNITRGRGRTLRELVDLIKARYPDTVVEEAAGDSFRPKRGSLDVSHARELLGYDPNIELEEGVGRYADYLDAAFDHVAPAR